MRFNLFYFGALCAILVCVSIISAAIPDSPVSAAEEIMLENSSDYYEFVTKWGVQGSGDGEFISPRQIALDNDGNIYVADNGNARIQKFSSNGTFLMKYGTPVPGDGFMQSAMGVAVDINGNVYVADYNQNCIHKFSNNGTFLLTWGEYGTFLDGQFYGPHKVAVDKVGNVYVADHMNNRVQKFSSNGTFSVEMGRIWHW